MPREALSRNPLPKLKPSLLARPVKETKRPQATISIAPILRRKPMKEVYGSKHLRRHGMRLAQHESFFDYQDQLDNSRDELLNASFAALQCIHDDGATAVSKLKQQDADFFNTMEAQRQSLFAPIVEETIETDFTRDGKSVKETFKIGQRIEAFKLMLATKEAELDLYWAEWEKVQAKIVQLGVDVLGPEIFKGLSTDDAREKKGYSKYMEEMDLEHHIWLEKIEEEIQLLGEESLKKLRATEKELNATSKREQASFIAQILASND